MYWQQDGAPAHYNLQVRAWLNAHFPNRWIGRKGPIPWPARSPDLSAMDFFTWGVIKEKVYARRPKSVVEMRSFIYDAFSTLNSDLSLLETVCLAVKNRCQCCAENNGKHFEHLLYQEL